MTYTVRDNGAGFDMRYGKVPLRPFQRLPTTEDCPGTGVGLATGRRIEQRHGGREWAEGEAGKGAAFHLTLGEETWMGRGDGNRVTLLVRDDSADEPHLVLIVAPDGA